MSRNTIPASQASTNTSIFLTETPVPKPSPSKRAFPYTREEKRKIYKHVGLSCVPSSDSVCILDSILPSCEKLAANETTSVTAASPTGAPVPKSPLSKEEVACILKEQRNISIENSIVFEITGNSGCLVESILLSCEEIVANEASSVTASSSAEASAPKLTLSRAELACILKEQRNLLIKDNRVYAFTSESESTEASAPKLTVSKKSWLAS
ncbi:hypothetical protein DSO57_1039479 [Entomophthora muscae]|uniref:Uncharacterized protein n=1 Tax=Entomophthora muscae TaxID=34485 RepID=A0ACC2RD57_9FUNG|nr:hypothetical protein DSO57_1039479 [Entomophthora muscae]